MMGVCMESLGKFFHRITKDLRQKELLPLKILFFVHASTIFVLYPYLTIHARELGISVEETAIMSAVTPVVAIIMPPIAGMVADRIGNFRYLLATFSALGGGASLLLLLVPVGRVTITYPTSLVMDVGCSDVPGPLQLGIVGSEPCNQVHSNVSSLTRIESRLESCGFVCQSTVKASEEDLARILTARSYVVSLSNKQQDQGNVSGNIFHTYTLSRDDMPKVHDVTGDLREHRVKHNNEHFRTSIRKISSDSYFFPTTDLYNMMCEFSGDDPSQYLCRFVAREGDDKSNATRNVLAANVYGLTNVARSEFVANSVNLRLSTAKKNRDLYNATCKNEIKDVVTVSVPLQNPNNSLEIESHSLLGNCKPRCLVTLPRPELCSNDKTVIEYNVQLTFWTYLVIRVFIGVIGGTAFAMFEGAVIAILREHKADYGLQRIYATIGGMISSPLSGLLIDYASKGKDYTDFRPAFYLYAALKIASGILMLKINLEFKAPATNVINDVLHVLKNVEIIALFIALFIMGTAWGYLESFLFWLLQDLGASRSLMGITITVGGVAGIPLLVLSGPIINRIGHANVLFIGFIFYGIRLLGYSLIYDPWLCLIFEAMESVTSSLSFTAAVTYAARLSTMSTDSSIQGLLGGLYYGVGKGAGSLIGGYMMTFFGTRETYRIFAAVCVIVGTIYFCFNRFYLRKRPRREGNDIVKKKPKKIENGGMETDFDLCKEKNNTSKNNYITNESSPIGKTLNNTYGNVVNDVKTVNEINKTMAKSLKESKPTKDKVKQNKENSSGNSNVGYEEGENVPKDENDKDVDVPKSGQECKDETSTADKTENDTKNDCEKSETH